MIATDISQPLAGKWVARIEKYHDGRTPDDGSPDAVEEQDVWHEADGAIVTDPARIAEIEAGMLYEEDDDDEA